MTAEWVWLIVPERAPRSQLQKEYLSHSTARDWRVYFYKIHAASDWPAGNYRAAEITPASRQSGQDPTATCEAPWRFATSVAASTDVVPRCAPTRTAPASMPSPHCI